jgi:type I restriction enzyme S subunit
MAGEPQTATLRDLLVTTKDGDWGSNTPVAGHVACRVIRGTDFQNARVGKLESIPLRYLDESTIHRRLLEPDDILLETAGGAPGRPTGRSLLVTDRLLANLGSPSTCSSFARFLRIDRTRANPRYIFWFLQSLYAAGRMEEHQVQHTGVARFQFTRFAETEKFLLPSRYEQDEVAKVLGCLDDKIEMNRRIAETLEEIPQTLFKSWFVDFEPTRAKAEGRPTGLPDDVGALFPPRFGDDGRPDGWITQSILDQADWVNGAAYKDMHFSNALGALPVVKIAELKNGITGSTKHTNTDLGDKYRIRTGELLFSWSGSPETSIDTFIWVNGDAWLNQHIFAVRPDGKRSRAYLYAMLKVFKGQLVEIARNKQTSGLGHVTRQDLARLKINDGGAEVLERFDVVAEPIFQKLQAVLLETQTLADLRDTLLPKLISGELRIADAEKRIAVA